MEYAIVFVGLVLVCITAAIIDFHNHHCKNQQKIIDFLQNGIKDINITIHDKDGVIREQLKNKG